MRRTLLASILICLILCLPAHALEFSADTVSTAKGHSFTAKIYVSGDKVRLDAPGAVTITRIDKKVAWVIMPEQKMYMERPFSPESVAGATEKMQGEVERALIGPDTIDGRPAKKYRVRYVSGKEETAVFQWIDSASNIPVKTAAEDGSWEVGYKNLVIGAQPASLFEVPAGYQEFKAPDMNEMMRAAKEAVGDTY